MPGRERPGAINHLDLFHTSGAAGNSITRIAMSCLRFAQRLDSVPDAPAVGEIGIVFQLHSVVGIPVPQAECPSQDQEEDTGGDSGGYRRTALPPLPDPLPNARWTGADRFPCQEAVQVIR